MGEPVRVLVVDDSSFFRKRVREFLESTTQIEVVGEATNGAEAVQMNRELSPQLITMDVAMPVLDGIAAVRQIMAEHPTKVIMFSALTREGAQSTLDALEAGAIDFLPKVAEPGSEASDIGPLLRQRVLDIAAQSALGRRSSSVPKVSKGQQSAVNLVVIGASTGGPVAVQKVLTQLPAHFPFPILVAVHMPAAFTPTYAERLDSLCALKVRHANDGDRLRPGEVLIAPGGYQTLVDQRAGSLIVRVGPAGDQLYKPCVDLTFQSAARAAGAHVLALVLTGMGSDGRDGALALKQAGSHVWTQDQASSVVYGMPQAVSAAGASDRSLPIDQMAAALAEVH